MSASARLEHAGSPVRLDLDEPVALEADQRLAHGGLGDTELCRDARLDELLAGLERAGDDLVPEPLVDPALELGGNDFLTGVLCHRRSYIVSRRFPGITPRA